MNPKALYQDGNEILFFAAHTAFDVSQEKDRVKAGYQGAAERYAPGNGPAAARETDTRALNVGAYFDSAGKSLAASIHGWRHGQKSAEYRPFSHYHL